jgi:nitroreductase/NAD-dependent dihydropyrimidine dehydrogenase PreA subunit
MLELAIDRERCIQCGECVADCPAGVLTLDGHPVAVEESRCIGCQHCLAVCPTAALSVHGVDPDLCTPLESNLPDPARLATLIMGRRSVRRYMDEEVAPRVIDELLEIARHGPTGVNAQQVLFTVVAERKVTEAFREEIYDRLAAVVDRESGEYMMRFLSRAVKVRRESGQDVILRNAPHMVLTSAPSRVPTPVQDCLIALTTFDLMAQAMGLGTVWNGMLYWVVNDLLPDLKARLSIPEDHVLGYAMSFGRPAVHYLRTVRRGPARLNRVGSWGVTGA